jgi:predicted HicB family RNase H-like nuclease
MMGCMAEDTYYRLNVDTPRELGREVRLAAFDAGISMRAWILAAIREKLSREATE